MIKYNPEKAGEISVVSEREGGRTIDFKLLDGIWWLLKENKLRNRPVNGTERAMLEAILEMVNYGEITIYESTNV